MSVLEMTFLVEMLKGFFGGKGRKKSFLGEEMTQGGNNKKIKIFKVLGQQKIFIEDKLVTWPCVSF